MLAGIAITAILALSASVLAADPALAVDISATSVSNAHGHTCKDISNGHNTAVLCVDLGIYFSSNGQAHVTAQAEAICQNGYTCEDVYASASVEHGTSYPTPASVECSPCVETNGRTYFFPFNGVNINYGGPCVNNVWATVFQQPSNQVTFVEEVASNGSGAGFNYPDLTGNMSTPHFDVCEGAQNTFSFTQIT